MRLAVNWFDDQNNTFSCATIDTTLPPYDGNSVEGQSVICASPNNSADSGIWTLGSHSDPTQVPVTRRDDSDISSVFHSGEMIARFDVNGAPNIIYRVSDIWDDSVGQSVAEATLDGTGVYITWQSLIASDVVFNAISVGGGAFTADDTGADALNFEADERCVAKAFVHSATSLTSTQSPIATLQRTCTFLLDASGGNVVFNLPSGAVPDVSAKSVDITVKRTDSSGNSVTIQVQSGEKLEGVVDGTIALAPLEAAVFTNFEADPNEWWRVGQYLP